MRYFCHTALLMVLLNATSVAQAAPDKEIAAQLAMDRPGLEFVSPLTSTEGSPAQESEGVPIPEPQTLLLAALAICGLSTVHLRRRWG